MDELAKNIVFADGIQRDIYQCVDCLNKLFIADVDYHEVLTCKCGGFHCSEHAVNYKGPDHSEPGDLLPPKVKAPEPQVSNDLAPPVVNAPVQLAPPVVFKPVLPKSAASKPVVPKLGAPKPVAPKLNSKVNLPKKPVAVPNLVAPKGKPGRKPSPTIAKNPPPDYFDAKMLNAAKAGSAEGGYSVLEMREILRHMGLSMTGKKQDLIDRIQMNLPAQTTDEVPTTDDQ